MSGQIKLATTADYMGSFLFSMQGVIKDYLYTDELYEDFPIVTEDIESFPQQFQQALAGVLRGPTGKAGIAILLHTMRGGGSLVDVPAAFNLNAEALFIILEMPSVNRGAITNGTGVPALVLAEAIMATMKCFQSSEIQTYFREAENAMSAPLIDTKSGLVMHSVKMLFAGGVTDTTKVCEPPVISVDAATNIITMTCPTDGAVIYWTGDGITRPTKEATAYVAPFDASVYGELWARAYRPGWRGSIIVKTGVQVALQSEEGADLKSEAGQTLRAG